MRMWNVDPELLCRKHLLGEHVEMHMFVGTLNKNISVKGYVRDGLVEIHKIRERHDLLAKELEKRGYNHKSPLPDYKEFVAGVVSIDNNLTELSRRCPDCKGRITNGKIPVNQII